MLRMLNTSHSLQLNSYYQGIRLTLKTMCFGPIHQIVRGGEVQIYINYICISYAYAHSEFLHEDSAVLLS